MKSPRRPAFVRHPRDWSLALKVSSLCVAITVTLSIGLSVIGYNKASEGLREQARAGLGSDGRVVAQALESWNAQRFSAEDVVLGLTPVRNAPLPAFASDDAVRAATQEALDSTARAGATAGVNMLSVMAPDGTIVLASDAAGLGVKAPQRDYFQAAMRGQRFVTGVTIPSSSPLPAIYHSAPIPGADGKPVGVLMTRSGLDAVSATVSAARDRAGKGAQGVLLDENGLVIASTIDEGWMQRPVVTLQKDVLDALVAGKRWGSAAAPEALGQNDLAQAVGVTAAQSFVWRSGSTIYEANAMPVVGTKWVYVSALPQATIDAAANDFLRQAILAAVIGTLVASALAIVVARSLALPIRRLTAAAAGLARGDIEQDVPSSSDDEVGQMASAFRDMVAYQREMADVASAMADGDLTSDIRPQSERDVLGRSFQRMTVNLRQFVGEVQHSAESLAEASTVLGGAAEHTSAAVTQVTSAAQGVATGAQDTSRRAQETNDDVVMLSRATDGIARGASDQAHQVQSASETATRMGVGVEQVAAQAGRVSDASHTTREAAEHGASAVSETVASMIDIQTVVGQAALSVEELGKLGDKIGAVVETIDDIAAQTNLLALNAAIEAARAGEHGKGFAVVADEVRKLAERSGRETKQIAALIKDVQQGTRDAVHAMELGSARVKVGSQRADEAGRALQQILSAIDDTVRQVSDIAVSAHEMASASQVVVEAMQSISAVVEENTASTEEMAAQATRVTESIANIAAVSEEQSASTEELSASAEEMSAQVQEIGEQAQLLAGTADRLRQLVAPFRATVRVDTIVSLRRAA